MYNTSPSEFHIVCDDDAEEFLRSRFALVHHPQRDVLVRFYKLTWQSMLDRIQREGTISTDHSAGLRQYFGPYPHFPILMIVFSGVDETLFT